MTIVAENYRYVIGVDTHAKKHQYAVTDTSGQILAERAFPTSPAGISRATHWLGQLDQAPMLLASVDGAGSYGRILAGSLTGAGIRVVEAPSIRYRPTGKDDQIDARAAATTVLPLDEKQLKDCKTGPERDAAQVLLTARRQMTRDKTRSINALTALLRRFDLGIDARTSLSVASITQVAAWRARTTDSIDIAIARNEAVRLARHIRDLEASLADNKTTMHHLASQVVPQLLAEYGIGPVSALQFYASWSHAGRIHSAEAFVRLAGAAPKPASSGNKSRHRLDRGGDRQLNAALHRVIITRWRNHPETLAYIEKRRAENTAERDIRRCLKRYLARRVYNLLQGC